MRHSMGFSLALALGLSQACAAPSSVDIGDGHVRPAGVLGESLTDYAGTWEGYVEAFSWADGTDHIRITLDSSGTGTLRIGTAADIAPPDPQRGYPPAYANPKYNATLAPKLVPGFAYGVHNANIESQRIRLTIATSELYREWCAKQPSYPDIWQPPSFACVTGLSVGGGDANTPAMCTALNGRPGSVDDLSNAVPVDCGQALTCSEHCVCDAKSCIAWGGDDVLIDAALRDDGNALEGTLVVVDMRFTVRLTRK